MNLDSKTKFLCTKCGKQFDAWGLCPKCDYPRMKSRYGTTPTPNTKQEI